MTDGGEAMARLRVHNAGPEPLELVLEPYGSDHWLAPGQTFVVLTLHEQPWAGPGEPFEVDYRPGSVTVSVNSAYGYVTDEDGNDIDCGHGRPSS